MIGTAAAPATGELATQGRRLAGFILDVLIAIFPIPVIVWLVWFLVIAGRGQTPAKQILKMRIVREDGQSASYGWMLLREIVVKVIAFVVLSLILTTIFGDTIGFWVYIVIWAACALWCVWDANRQCLWDKAVRTFVVHDPDGVGAVVGGAAPAVRTEATDAAENLRTLAEMRDRGLLTDAEYEERRQRELERL